MLRGLKRSGFSRLIFPLFVGTLLVIGSREVALGQSAPTQLKIAGDLQHPLPLSLDDLRKLPRTTVKVANEHQGDKEEVYEGVSLAALLKQAGAPVGQQLRGNAMATYVLAESADGYRVLFSLAELDSGYQNSEVIVADELNGAPLGNKVGPLRLVAPNDKRAGRWVRMLQSIKIVSVPK